MSFSPFWEDDEEEAARLNAANAANSVQQAKDYVSQEASKLETAYQQKYSDAQAHFDSQQKDLDSYSSTITDTIQKINSSSQQADIARANNGPNLSYSSDFNAPPANAQFPLVIGIVLFLGYYYFSGKRS